MPTVLAGLANPKHPERLKFLKNMLLLNKDLFAALSGAVESISENEATQTLKNLLNDLSAQWVPHPGGAQGNLQEVSELLAALIKEGDTDPLITKQNALENRLLKELDSQRCIISNIIQIPPDKLNEADIVDNVLTDCSQGRTRIHLGGRFRVARGLECDFGERSAIQIARRKVCP